MPRTVAPVGVGLLKCVGMSEKVVPNSDSLANRFHVFLPGMLPPFVRGCSISVVLGTPAR